MGAKSRRKGARGELEVVHLLRGLWHGVKRGLTQTRGGGDVADVEGSPYWIEVKIGKRPNIVAAMAQALEARAERGDARPPVVFTRRDGEEWLVTMRARDWVAEREARKAETP